MDEQLKSDLDRIADVSETVYGEHEILPDGYVGISQERLDAYRRLADFARRTWEQCEGL